MNYIYIVNTNESEGAVCHINGQEIAFGNQLATVQGEKPFPWSVGEYQEVQGNGQIVIIGNNNRRVAIGGDISVFTLE